MVCHVTVAGLEHGPHDVSCDYIAGLEHGPHGVSCDYIAGLEHGPHGVSCDCCRFGAWTTWCVM